MFNFDFQLFMYFLKLSHCYEFDLMSDKHKKELNILQKFPDIQFFFNQKLKVLYFLYQTKLALLFVAFVFLGFFFFASLSSIFYNDSLSLAFAQTWSDFVKLHYVSLFICLLTIFSLLNLAFQVFEFKMKKYIHQLKLIPFPLTHFTQSFQSELHTIETTPLFHLVTQNNNLYGLMLFLIFAKHIEQQELKLIPHYF